MSTHKPSRTTSLKISDGRGESDFPILALSGGWRVGFAPHSEDIDEIGATIKSMFDHIKLWLFLRVLQDQEEHVITERKESLEMFRNGSKLYISPADLASDISRIKVLLPAFLPSFVRKFLRPRSSKEYGKRDMKMSEVRRMYSIIRLAHRLKYVESDDVRRKWDDDLITEKNGIRVSPEGDRFATYFGGVEGIIRAYPRVWVLLTALITSPAWFPLVKNLLHLLLPGVIAL